MINFDDFKYNKASIPADALEKQKYLKQLEDCFYDELNSSEAAKAYFNNYRPDSIENFKKNYVTRKVHLIQFQAFYSREHHHSRHFGNRH